MVTNFGHFARNKNGGIAPIFGDVNSSSYCDCECVYNGQFTITSVFNW